MGSAALAAAVLYPGKATRFSLKTQASTKQQQQQQQQQQQNKNKKHEQKPPI